MDFMESYPPAGILLCVKYIIFLHSGDSSASIYKWKCYLLQGKIQVPGENRREYNVVRLLGKWLIKILFLHYIFVTFKCVV